MNSLRRTFTLSIVSLLALLLLSSAPVPAATPALAGSYKITENTDLGSQVRITVLITLYNPGATSLTLSQIAFRDKPGPSQPIGVKSTLVIHSHSHSQTSMQFLISKSDFKTWQTGPNQQFLLTCKSTGGKSVVLNIPLLRTRG